MITNQDLLNELLEMKRAGVKVDDNVLNHARTDDLVGYERAGLEELANMFCELYNWTDPKRNGYPWLQK